MGIWLPRGGLFVAQRVYTTAFICGETLRYQTVLVLILGSIVEENWHW